jgi:uncharacterized RDD family membrane protein YckC
MYSVGATLFYLLTGRTPFEGKNPVQLLATVLEKPATSPRQLRSSVPNGLAQIVLRCLEKLPDRRFKNYSDLAKALAPFSSVAPTPATLGLRAVAGLIDVFVLSSIGTAVTWFAVGNPMELLNLFLTSPSAMLVWLGIWLTLPVLYYALFESRVGATPGKLICQLRVVEWSKNPPTFWRAAVRALIYIVIPMLPSWSFYASKPSLGNSLPQAMVGLSYYALIAVLFSTARRRNGFAAIHDLLTGIRVVSRTALLARPTLSYPEPPPTAVAGTRTIGPYQVLETIGEAAGAQWHLGYDLRLLRKVWLRVVPEGTPSVPSHVRNLARIGRLRWLSGRRSAGQNWDAYEAPTGMPLLTLAQKKQHWAEVRFWLFDLANELSAAQKDHTCPAVVALDRVWITGDGRAKLLDFPAPGLIHQAPDRLGFSPPVNPSDLSAGCQPPSSAPVQTARFLLEVAATALGRCLAPTDHAPNDAPPLPLPIYARDFFRQLDHLSDASAIAATLKPLLHRLANVTRLRRITVLAACLAFPLVAGLSMLFGTVVMQQWRRAHPGVMELTTLLQQRSNLHRWGRRAPNLPTDSQYAIYLVSHYAQIITNRSAWSDPFTLALLKNDQRRFAEQSITNYPSPSPQQITDAETAMKPFVPKVDFFDLNRQFWFPLAAMTATLLMFVAIPAIIASVAFRGGLILRLAGVGFVRRDGTPASRLRLLWRTCVAWTPVLAAIPCYGVITHYYGQIAASVCVAVLLGCLAFVSVLLPHRGLQDRLAGTWPVPR